MNEAHLSPQCIGFLPDEIDISAPTRAARLKWVIVVNDALPPGRAVNAAVCVAAATSRAVSGLLGPDAVDAEGNVHHGLPWAGCTVLAAEVGVLRKIHATAAASAGTFVAGMPAAAQDTRVYAEYLEAMRKTSATETSYCAVSIIGPRNRVDKIVGRLPLMP